MHRRYFDHIYNEICVALGRRTSRYDLWLLLSEGGADPDDLTPGEARTFVERNLSKVLREEGARLDARTHRRLEKSILRFDPSHPTPEEWIARSIDPDERAA